jgi:uncharacterized membrane protein YcaP (DUF421 family)
LTTASFFKRLLLGDAPWAFLLEVFVRVVGVYLVLVVVVRLLGKRLSGQVGNPELGVIIALGAIVSVPFQDPARGVLPGSVLLILLLVLQRSLSALGVRYPRVEAVTQNRVSRLVSDGKLELGEMRGASVSLEQLFAVLRVQGVRHLGEVKRVYFEAYGMFSVYRETPARDGLALEAAWDKEPTDRLPQAKDVLACRGCGEVRRDTAFRLQQGCARCGARRWTHAIAGG